MEERTQYELKGREGMEAMTRNLAPPFRAGLAGAATSAAVASAIAEAPPAQDAADVMTGKKPGKAVGKVRIRGAKATAPVVSVVGVSQEGGSSGSTDPGIPVLGAGFALQTPPAKGPKGGKAKAPPKDRPRSNSRPRT